MSLLLSLIASLATGLAESPVPQGGSLPAADQTPFPQPGTVRGLQVQMVPDAVELGIKHAGINVSLGQLFAKEDTTDALTPSPTAVKYALADGTAFSFSSRALQQLDAQVKPLSDAGALVYFILLPYRTGNPAIDRWLIHPQAKPDHTYTIPGFNTVTAEGRQRLEAVFGVLAQRYSGPSAAEHGRVWGWIVGNEVNSHWMWANCGKCSLEKAVSDYEPALRLCQQAVARHSAQGRVYVSFDHHWTASMPGISAEESTPGRAYLETLARVAKERGDFPWHVATHPYPDDLGNPRTWLDKAAEATPEARHITFKNLEVMDRFMHRPELLWQGQPRRLILSEQGFHCLATPEGEQLQAAAFCYAWEKVKRCPGVDAFIWHRHVDHKHEGGLRLGLYERESGSISNPGKKRPLWHLIQAAGTPAWTELAAPYLKTVGLTSWDELTPAQAGP